MAIYGTRPEVIKLAPVIKELHCSEQLDVCAVSTGQHREMLDQAAEWFDMNHDHSLQLMTVGQSLNSLVARILNEVERLFEAEKPDLVLVQGDTSSAMAASLAAFNYGLPIVHLEAGLRTGDLNSPFPEEGNRKIIGQLASLHLAPTLSGRMNLVREGVDEGAIKVIGNTVIDALLSVSELPVSFDDPAIQHLVESGKRFVLVTTHRRENISVMGEIAQSLVELSKRYPETCFLLPLHLNPEVRQVMVPELAGRPNIIVTQPQEYPQFASLMRMASLVLTDSGGVQEEAPTFGKPVLVMRTTSEREEGLMSGAVRLVGTNAAGIVSSVSKELDAQVAPTVSGRPVNPYGDGRSARRAVGEIEAFLGLGKPMKEFESVLDSKFEMTE